MKQLITSIFMLAGICFASSVYAQPENVVRMGVSSFAANHFNLAYERVLGDKTSANLQFGYVYGFGGSALNNSQVEDITTGFDLNPFTGIVIHPEFRFYSAKHGAPRGFYFAPYFRYSNVSSDGTYNWDAGVPGAVPNIMTSTVRYSHAGLGIQLGTQFMIKDMVAIDFFWMGPRLYAQNTYTFSLKGNPDPSGMGGLDMTDVAQSVDLEGSIGDLPVVGGLINYSQTASADELEMKIKHPIFLFPWRFGLSVGYAF